jgi:hypothetical protein
MVSNLDRSEWAAAALRHFQCITGTDWEDSLGDLLCDLMHFADANNFDFKAAVVRASNNYIEELDETDTKGGDPANKMNVAETAIYANLSALAEQLAEASKLSAEAAAASKCGKQNQAIGTALPLEDLLSQSKALYDAAIALHRHASRG